MGSKLIALSPHESQNQFELSLREAFHLHEPKLKPPLKRILPSPPDYLTLTRAIAYGVLCEPQLARAYIKHLHAVVNDGYEFFVKLLVQIVDDLYPKLVDTAKKQLLWVTSVVVDVAGLGFQNLLVSLMRQIVGGDLSFANLWLSFELVNLLLLKWDSILDEEPDVLTSALYVFLRLLSDHYRLPNIPNSRELKQKEIEFCLKTLREQFCLCMKLGRDLIRLLQDLFHIPEFRAFWKVLVLDPSSLKAPGFSDIRDLYRLRTPNRYFLLRVTPEMETQLRFLLTSVKWRGQRRHQAWFARKFLCAPERETLICDIVRFICCAHHPSNEILQSEIIQRWDVIGWLLRCCTRKYYEANVKLALFFDWLFFDEKVDRLMNIEPAMLLMVNSMPRDVVMTQSLLEFLILLVDKYDVDRQTLIFEGVSSAFSCLVLKGVIRSMDILISCEALSPFKEKLKMFMLRTNSQVHSHADHVSSLTSPSTLALDNSLPVSSRVSVLSGDLRASSLPNSVESASDAVVLRALIPKLGENMKKSKVVGLETLEKILFLYVNLDCQGEIGDLQPEVLASKISMEVELGGYCLFSPLESLPESLESDDDIQSPTAVIIRVLIHSQNQKIKQMLQFWSRKGRPASTRLLSYALRLAYEVEISLNETEKDYATDTQYETMPLLKFHIDSYLSFRGGTKSNNLGSDDTCDFKVDRNIALKLVGSAFSSYRDILVHLRDVTSKEKDISFTKFLSTDLVRSSEWKRKRLHILFRSIFSFLSDMSVGQEGLIRLLVSRLEDSELASIQFDLALKKFSIFGDSFRGLTQLLTSSINRDPIEQHRLWGLIRSELSVANFPVEKLLLSFFSSPDIDPNRSSLVVGGLSTLCSCCAPTPELVGAILLLPNHNFPDFSAAVLACWITSCPSALFSSVAGFLDKLKTMMMQGGVSVDFRINKSAVEYLVSCVEAHGAKTPDSLLENLLQTLSDMKTRIED